MSPSRLLLTLLFAARAAQEDAPQQDHGRCPSGGPAGVACGDDEASLLALKYGSASAAQRMGNLAEKMRPQAPDPGILDDVTTVDDSSELPRASALESDEFLDAAAEGPVQTERRGFATPAATFKRRRGFTLAGKSIYFLMTDRFARSGRGPMGAKNHTYCDLDSNGVDGWCGGTFQGIIRKLPYIKGMGFDCIWISPPIDAVDYTGYYAKNFFKINRHWGSARDLQRLSWSLRRLGMCLVVDVVTNHVRSLVGSDGKALVTGNAVPVVPFSRAYEYHQLNKTPGTTFEQYVIQGPPYASSGTGNTQHLQAGVEAGIYHCGPDYPEISYCSCFPGNLGVECPGASETLQWDGWFGSLGDLNQSVPSVRRGLINFVTVLRDTFGADAIRLDTAVYQSREWLSELQKEVGIEILGEATVVNITYAGTYQYQRSNGRQVLKGLLNFPPFYWLPRAFCSYYLLAPFAQYSTYQGTWSSTPPNLTQVAAVINSQQTGGKYSNLDLLGNFADNHDEFARLGWYCKEDSQRIKNILALLFFMRGVPIVYYGTEQGLLGHQLTKEESKDYTIPTGQFKLRESLWQTYYRTSTWQYEFIAQLNRVRKAYDFGVGEMNVLSMKENTMVFTRAPVGKGAGATAWAFINNFDNSTKKAVKYCPGPRPEKGYSWYDALSGKKATLGFGCYWAADSLPKLLVRERRS
uniref:Glycosyl hydrolase family 13 catalytic domain-containing protein n=2 Tax=Alexandrium monilatum TaxID=311494 RepID=A0A7S4W443_9DINO